MHELFNFPYSASEGGYCNNTQSCICHEGFAGQNCEIGEFPSTYTDYKINVHILVLTVLDSCSHQRPCEDREICTNDNTSSLGYTCHIDDFGDKSELGKN